MGELVLKLEVWTKRKCEKHPKKGGKELSVV